MTNKNNESDIAQPALVDLSEIPFSTQQGQAEYLYYAMQNEYVSSQKEGDDDFDKARLWPESERAKYGMSVMLELMNKIGSDKSVRQLIREEEQRLEAMQTEMAQKKHSEAADNSLTERQNVLSQLRALLDGELKSRLGSLSMHEEFAQEERDILAGRVWDQETLSGWFD